VGKLTTFSSPEELVAVLKKVARIIIIADLSK